MKARLDYVEGRYNDIQDSLLHQEMDRRQANLLIHGMPEKLWEKRETTELIAKEYFSAILKVPTMDMRFKNIFRIGARGHAKKRPILISFTNMEDRDRVWKSKHLARENTENTPSEASEEQNSSTSNQDQPTLQIQNLSEVFITQDYPQEIQKRRRRLLPIFKRAKSMEEYKDTTYIRHDKLVIKGETYNVTNIHNLPSQLNPISVSTLRQGDCIFFWGVNSPFSNHHPAVFVIDGVRYSCAEQYYMYQMAMAAKDGKKAQSIMATDDPVIHKQISKSIKRHPDWNKMAKTHMLNALRSKFSQNATLRYYLANTGPHDIAEASRFDTSWGIGLPLDSEEKQDKSKWKGENQLGKLLCVVREELKAKR